MSAILPEATHRQPRYLEPRPRDRKLCVPASQRVCLVQRKSYNAKAAVQIPRYFTVRNTSALRDS